MDLCTLRTLPRSAGKRHRSYRDKIVIFLDLLARLLCLRMPRECLVRVPRQWKVRTDSRRKASRCEKGGLPWVRCEQAR